MNVLPQGFASDGQRMGRFEREARVLIVFHRLGQAEVQHLYRAVLSELDVRGLEVAVDDAMTPGDKLGPYEITGPLSQGRDVRGLPCH